MRRGLTSLVQVPMLVLASGFLLQTQLLAQHAGATRSITPGHLGGTVHPSPAPTFAGPSRVLASTMRSPTSQAFPPRHWPYGAPAHSPGGDGDRKHRQRYPAIYAGYPWLSYGYGVPLGYGMSYAGDQDDTAGPPPGPQQQPDQSLVDYGMEPPSPQVAANAAGSFRPLYQGPSQDAPVHAQPTTILIFKDGRPPEKVHNYALTASTLYALDGDSGREIPLALLNVPATVETNRTAGVDFALPVSR